MEWLFEYDVKLENGDGEAGEWPEELSSSETNIMLDSVLDGSDPEDIPEFREVISRVYDAVMADVAGDLLETIDPGDDYEYGAEDFYDGGMDIEINAAEPDLTDDTVIEALIRRAVARSRTEGCAIVDRAIKEFGALYSDDPEEYAVGVAVILGAEDYLKAHRKVSAVAETEEEETDFSECRFAVNSADWKILSFRPDFQREIFENFLDQNGLELADVLDYLDGDGPEPDYRGDLKRSLHAIGMYSFRGEPAFEDLTGEDGCEAMELIEWLGFNCSSDYSTGNEINYIK